jgi:hypothetical protein
MKTRYRLRALSIAGAFFASISTLVAQRLESCPTLSSDQYRRITEMHPNLHQKVFVQARVHTQLGEVTKVDIVTSCGVPDVDQAVKKWLWNNYRLSDRSSGSTLEQICVSFPIVKNPQIHLSPEAYREIYKTRMLSAITISLVLRLYVQDAKIVSATVLHSSGLPTVDQSCRDFVQKKWRFAPGTNQKFTLPMTIA